MIYTKTGDKGETSLIGGTRVSKCHPRVEAYGTVDELNSQIGVVAAAANAIAPDEVLHLVEIQKRLFIIQGLLATDNSETFHKLPSLPSDAVSSLESHIDTLTAQLPALHSFILPGGNMASAQCHVARCVCRRAERLVVALNEQVLQYGPIMQYLNRLSDYLFTLARFLNINAGTEENCISAI